MKKILLSLAFLMGVAFASNAQTAIPADIEKLLQKNTCLACHKVDVKLVGPAYKAIMRKYKYKPEQIVELIYKPNASHWPGFPPMAALPQVPKDEALKMAKWISTLK